jgi:hypothetical protein
VASIVERKCGLAIAKPRHVKGALHGSHRKELNFAPVAPTSAHTESIFSVVFENLADTEKK